MGVFVVKEKSESFKGRRWTANFPTLSSRSRVVSQPLVVSGGTGRGTSEYNGPLTPVDGSLRVPLCTKRFSIHTSRGLASTLADCMGGGWESRGS